MLNRLVYNISISYILYSYKKLFKIKNRNSLYCSDGQSCYILALYSHLDPMNLVQWYARLLEIIIARVIL